MSTLYHYVVDYTFTDENYLDKSDRTELVVEKARLLREELIK